MRRPPRSGPPLLRPTHAPPIASYHSVSIMLAAPDAFASPRSLDPIVSLLLRPNCTAMIHTHARTPSLSLFSYPETTRLHALECSSSTIHTPTLLTTTHQPTNQPTSTSPPPPAKHHHPKAKSKPNAPCVARTVDGGQSTRRGWLVGEPHHDGGPVEPCLRQRLLHRAVQACYG